MPLSHSFFFAPSSYEELRRCFLTGFDPNCVRTCLSVSQVQFTRVCVDDWITTNLCILCHFMIKSTVAFDCFCAFKTSFNICEHTLERNRAFNAARESFKRFATKLLILIIIRVILLIKFRALTWNVVKHDFTTRHTILIATVCGVGAIYTLTLSLTWASLRCLKPPSSS